MNDVERRRRIHALGQRAIDYYDDTGECVFCNADDKEGIPHDDGCDVGAVSGIKVTAERVARKREQCNLADAMLGHNLSVEIDRAVREIEDE